MAIAEGHGAGGRGVGGGGGMILNGEYKSGTDG
jgi:hypothetical protein